MGGNELGELGVGGNELGEWVLVKIGEIGQEG